MGISGSVGQMFGALFGSEHLGTLLLTGGDTLLQCMNSVGARELEPVCELESGIVLARFAYQGAPATLLPSPAALGRRICWWSWQTALQSIENGSRQPFAAGTEDKCNRRRTTMT